MSKILVLAEKPSVGRDLARVLNCNIKGNGYLEGQKYIVTWALGHLVTLADPEAYDEKYKAWRLEDLPMLPKELKLVVIKQTGKQFSAVKEQLSRKDVSEVVIATDAGREGELVARWILEKAHINKPVKRLWISSVTDKAIRDGFSSLKPGREYENLYASAVARSESDWLVGINATRALTTKYNAQLSCGRVQTPTLAIIASREAEIKNFQPRTYYGITATAERLRLTWQESKTKESKTFEKEVCDKIIAAITGKKAEVIDVHKVSKKSFSPALYDLTELQRDANKIFGFSAKETLSIMQKLYETHKALTYPRTDSRYISTDIVETLKDRVKACDTGLYSKQILKILKAPIKAGSHFVDNGKVSDHHAIIPTEQPVVLNSLTDKEKKIYDLVVRRFLAVLYPPFEYEETTVKAQIGNEVFGAKGKTVRALGWKELYNNNLDDEESGDDIAATQTLPILNKGDVLLITAVALTKGETKPPAPFNEASLLSAMENPAKYMSGESQALKQIIGQTGGLGTVATRADIIEKLFSSFVIEKKGKDIFITSKGKQLLELAPSDLKSPALTAEWEQKLSAIAKGQLKKQAFIAEIKEYTQVIIREIKNSQEQFKHDNVTRTRCPECGKYLLEVNGKKGKSLVCQDRECGYRKNVAQVTNARCPNCHKKLEMRGEGDARAFVCGCGYREKLASFTERKKKEGETKISKKDVSRYLKEQQEDKPINNALAEALAKLKLQ
ncbi:DNA topoisomerase III [Sporomusa sp.]|uniref:DNA topoisomerase III n=1 Tax=Sporomusa sp. TaxID=2078658 RepID=UPI002BE48333|nr:DNA topoisomerase III [Sporomusa sp.]HWR45922.1 DNA topoisomerase III [Sporomusa sp.]